MTEERQEVPHLRLVAKTEEPVPSQHPTPGKRAQQLAFPYPDASAVFFVYVDVITQVGFAQILGDLTPRWIIDVRAVPRLDTVARSRSSAFQLFAKSKAEYVDLFGRLGIKSYKSSNANPAFWSSALIDILSASERKGPYFFLFDDERLLLAADQVLASTLKPLLGRFPQIARVQNPARIEAPQH